MEDQGEERGGWEKNGQHFTPSRTGATILEWGTKIYLQAGGVRSGKYSGEKTGVGGDKAVMEVNWEGDEGEGGRGR